MENDIDKMLEEIQHEINVLEAQKSALIQDFVFGNEAKFFAEVLDLITRTNITTGDYYAPDRKYSLINGFKNIRIAARDEDKITIDIKVTNKKGEYAARFWAAQSPVYVKNYKVSFCYSYSKRYWE